ncbi:MAG: DUF1698 domain-containing protein [Gammaproteobacteria bacterium]|nr:DUF1698 domain-containing protein [Gammaproteobacteria bacterium]
MQHLAVAAYVRRLNPHIENHLLPVTFEELPPLGGFDTVFSMGVLYHRREPVAHLRNLKDRLDRGGELILETLIIEGNEPLYPPGRYARMRNVHAVPDLATLQRWFESAGFTETAVLDTNRTTIEEQRTTAWMTFESLASALDPLDPCRTIEGHPAPVRPSSRPESDQHAAVSRNSPGSPALSRAHHGIARHMRCLSGNSPHRAASGADLQSYRAFDGCSHHPSG